MKDLKVFENDLFKVSAKLENDQVLFGVEEVARSLGLTQFKGSSIYVRWETVNRYLKKYVSQQVGKGDLIPEPLVYKLAFKASNELAEKFQDWLAIEVIPSIRKTGTYQKPQSHLEVLQGMINQMVEQDKRASHLESRVDHITEVIAQLDIKEPEHSSLESPEPPRPVLYTTEEIAKQFGYIGPSGIHKFNQILWDSGIIYPRRRKHKIVWKLYASMKRKGLKDLSTLRNSQKWTEKGKQFIDELMESLGKGVEMK